MPDYTCTQNDHMKPRYMNELFYEHSCLIDMRPDDVSIDEYRHLLTGYENLNIGVRPSPVAYERLKKDGTCQCDHIFDYGNFAQNLGAAMRCMADHIEGKYRE